MHPSYVVRCLIVLSEKIRILLIKRKMTMSVLVDKITSQNLSNKLSRDNFSEKEIQCISKALGCYLDISFKIEESGEQI